MRPIAAPAAYDQRLILEIDTKYAECFESSLKILPKKIRPNQAFPQY
jgi:hypothetical protein